MISVAMATYNGEKYIFKQIESILNQSVPVDEIVISDDGSYDRTIEILNTFHDDRIKIFHRTETLGYVKNFYEAISRTNGDIIFLADQDDIWELDKVSVLTTYIKRYGTAVMCSNFSLIDADDCEIKDRSLFQMNPMLKHIKEGKTEISLNKLLFGNLVQGCTYCFTSDIKRLFIELHNTEVIHDYQIMLIAGVIGKVVFINRPLIKYRIHSNNAVGFKIKNRKLEGIHRISIEPFMVRFFRCLNEIVRVPHLWCIYILYYLRIPFLIAIVRRKVFGE